MLSGPSALSSGLIWKRLHGQQRSGVQPGCVNIKKSDLSGLKKLASFAGELFRMGAVLYDGLEAMPLGDSFWAVPLSSLWGS